MALPRYGAAKSKWRDFQQATELEGRLCDPPRNSISPITGSIFYRFVAGYVHYTDIAETDLLAAAVGFICTKKAFGQKGAL